MSEANEREPLILPLVDCCATCDWIRGRIDKAWCGKHRIVVLAVTKCDTFERRAGLPVWVVSTDEEPQA